MRLRALAAWLVLASLLATACTSKSPGDVRVTAVDSTSKTTIAVGGDPKHPLTLSVSPGDVSGHGSVKSAPSKQPPLKHGWFTAAGQPTDIEFAGKLSAPLSMQFAAGKDHPTAVPVVFRHDIDLGWYPVAAGDPGGTASARRDHFSPHLSGWAEASGWLGDRVGSARRWVTGRTTPPDCSTAKPSWADLDAPTLDVLLTCANTNRAKGVDRAELIVKNNRGLTQEITVPSGAAYVAVEDQPEPVRRYVRQLAGGRDVVLLPPGKWMTVGFLRPAADRVVELTPNPSALALAADIVFHLADLADESGQAGVVAGLVLVAHCTGVNPQKLAGVTPGSLTAVKDLIFALMRCLVEAVADPGKAATLATEYLSLVTGLSKDLVVSDKKLAARLDSIAGKLNLLGKLAKGLKILELAGLAGVLWEGVGEELGRGNTGLDPATVRLTLRATPIRLSKGWVTVDSVFPNKVAGPGGPLQVRLVSLGQTTVYQGGPKVLQVTLQLRSGAPGPATYPDVQASVPPSGGYLYFGVRGLAGSECEGQVDGLCLIGSTEQTNIGSGDCLGAGPNSTSGNEWFFGGAGCCTVRVTAISNVGRTSLQPANVTVLWHQYSQPNKYVHLN